MKDIEPLIKKFWKGTASKDELEQLLESLTKEDSSDWRESLSADYFSAIKKEKKWLTVEESLNNLDKIAEKVECSNKPKLKFYPSYKALAVAASLLIIFIILVKWNQTVKKPETQGIVHVVNKELDTTIVNSFNKETTIEIVQGIEVTLCPQSRISFNKNIVLAQCRIVYLDGAAAFNVKHNPNKVFQVITQNIETSDIGTFFFVNSKIKNKVFVKLMKGVVSVRSLGIRGYNISPTLLSPGQELKIDLQKRISAIEYFAKKEKRTVQIQDRPKDLTEGNTSGYKAISTLDSSLDFHNDSLSHVIRSIRKIYNISIAYSQKDVEKLTFTGKFDSADSLDITLRMLCSLSELSYSYDGKDSVILFKKH